MIDIKETVKNYLVDNFFQGKEDAFTDDTTLLSSGVIDSISSLQLVEFIESSFGFEFEAHEVDKDNLDTLNIIVAFVEKKIEAK